MRYTIKRSNKEIDDVINKASDLVNDGESKVPGESYEAGVHAALQWVIGEQDESPI